MTAIKAFNLTCDHPECAEHGIEGAFDLNQWPHYQTASEVRTAAKKAGWTRTSDGKDMCPRHSQRKDAAS